jgi:ABC-type uncharacterized transport system involved in gliding motility auxiliary subunit
VLTSQIDNIWLPFAGSYSGTPADGLKETVLIHSTRDSQLVDGFMANIAGEATMKDFKASGTEYALAVRLSGKFKTAFPEGKPAEKKEDAAKPDEKKDEKKDAKEPDNSLKQSQKETQVILVGDADMLSDRVALQPVQSLFGGTMYQPANGNFALAQGAIEQLSGDVALINVRSRATLNRPFTRINEMETKANEQFQSKIKTLEDSRGEAQRKINELQQAKKDKDQRFILSPEQQAELVKLREQEVKTSKELKQVQKDLHKEVTSLESRLKVVNIAAVPALVCCSGLALAFVKRKRTGAK